MKLFIPILYYNIIVSNVYAAKNICETILNHREPYNLIKIKLKEGFNDNFGTVEIHSSNIKDEVGIEYFDDDYENHFRFQSKKESGVLATIIRTNPPASYFVHIYSCTDLTLGSEILINDGKLKIYSISSVSFH